jgi:TonB family protein
MTHAMSILKTPGRHRKRPVLGYFILISAILHGLVVGIWRGEPPAGPVAQSTFHITIRARRGDTPARSGSGAGQSAHDEARRSSAAPAPPRTGSKPGYTKAISPHALSANDDRAAAQPFVSATRRHQYRQPPTATRAQAQPGLATAAVTGSSPRSSEEESAALDFDPRTAGERNSVNTGLLTRGQRELSSDARFRRVQAALQQALLPRFEYPPIARRRGWEGRVKVGLHVGADGDLTRIHLVESSGYALLDSAAVKNVTELRNVPGAAQWIDADSMEVVLPVRYRLHNR